MKNFLKILLITALLQIGCYGFGWFCYNVPIGSINLSEVGLWIFLVSFPTSILVDMILALRWGKDLKQKLIYIFLMPTNYTGVALLLFAFWHVKQWLEILTGIPENFG